MIEIDARSYCQRVMVGTADLLTRSPLLTCPPLPSFLSLPPYNRTWGATEAWLTSPFHFSRSLPTHPPTYPISNHDLWEQLFRGRLNATSGSDGGGSAPGVALLSPQALHISASSFQKPLYDTYKKNRFTPSSWTDGMISFWV